MILQLFDLIKNKKYWYILATNTLVQNKSYFKECDSKSTYPEKRTNNLLRNMPQTFHCLKSNALSMHNICTVCIQDYQSYSQTLTWLNDHNVSELESNLFVMVFQWTDYHSMHFCHTFYWPRGYHMTCR